MKPDVYIDGKPYYGGSIFPELDERWVVCPSCDEIVPRNEANEHVCPIEGEDHDGFE